MWISKQEYMLLKMELDCTRSHRNELMSENKHLRKELDEAKNLKAILEKLTDKRTVSQILGMDFAYGKDSSIAVSNIGGRWEIGLGDNVPVYVEDLFGGRVIKQEGNKAIKITKDGTVTTGLTKQKVDAGYAYKLEREK